MAIVHVRIDERLIHGQVAMVWTNTVGASRIIVANDEAVKDDMIIAALKISKPAGVKLSILSRNKAGEKIGNGAYDDDRVFLIFQNIKDAAYCVEKGLKLSHINVGNVSQKHGGVPIKKSVALTQEDIELINGMLQKGIRITAQMLPTESDQSIAEYIKAAAKE